MINRVVIRVAAIVLVLGLASNVSTTARAGKNHNSKAHSAQPSTIKIAGFIHSCYKPKDWLVFVTAAQSENFSFESKVTRLEADGRFTITLDADKARPGDYYLNFGEAKDGTGSLRFSIKSQDIDLGVVGECDV